MMGLNDRRVQLLANLKFLYGSDMEVLTLCDDTLSLKYQAVALKFDYVAVTWSKYLHTEMCASTPGAIQTLLEMSERELMKFLSAAGNTVPFQGAMVHSLRREQQGNPNSGESVRSESVDVATPTSTFSRTTSDDFVHVEHSVEKAVVEDVNEKALAEEPVSVSKEPGAVPQESDPIVFDWRPLSDFKKDKRKNKASIIFEDTQPAEEELTEIPAEEPLGDDAFGWTSSITTKNDKKKKAVFTVDEIQPAEEQRTEVPGEEPPANNDFAWQPSLISKKDKKKKKSAFIFDDIQLAEEDPAVVPGEKPPAEARGQRPLEKVCDAYEYIEEVPACDPDPTPEPAVDFDWGTLSAKGKKKKCETSFEEDQPPSESAPEPAADFDWGIPLAKKDKKKKGKMIFEEEPSPEPEVDLNWCSFASSKKGKKKKGKRSFEEEQPAPSELAPEPEFDLSWVDFASSKKDNMKKGKTSFEEEQLAPSKPAPEPKVDFGWGALPSSKIDKEGKGNNLTEEEDDPFPELEPEPYPVEECQELKEDQPPSTSLPPSSPPPPPLSSPAPSEFQPEIGDIVLGTLRSEAPLQPESVGHPISASSRPAAAPTENTAHNLQALVAQNRRAIVLKIEFPMDTCKKSLPVMTTIADDSRTAIINSANFYLDSKSIGLQGQRKLEIKYGVGRNGDVDLSTLEETLWPEYLGYFCQYTKIPELTIDVVEC